MDELLKQIYKRFAAHPDREDGLNSFRQQVYNAINRAGYYRSMRPPKEESE